MGYYCISWIGARLPLQSGRNLINSINFQKHCSVYFQAVRILNGTFEMSAEQTEALDKTGIGKIPNGIVKIRAAASDDIDPMILVFTNYHENQRREGTFNGDNF